jgi:hypothetical protein
LVYQSNVLLKTRVSRGLHAACAGVVPEGHGGFGTYCGQRPNQTLSMSALISDVSPVPLPEQKPSNRGRFSDDRQYWEELHKRRYLQWQGGDGIEQIASTEGVTYNAVKHSLLWCEARLSRADVLAAHQNRLRLQAFGRLSNRYLDELERLLSDSNALIRSRALEQFRKTVGMESGGGVSVNVNQQTVVRSGDPRSFEEVMDCVRSKLATERGVALWQVRVSKSAARTGRSKIGIENIYGTRVEIGSEQEGARLIEADCQPFVDRTIG